MKTKIFRNKKTGRVAYDFPWESGSLPQPWRGGYRRVLVPLTESELRGSKKLVHCQIVADRNLVEVKELRFQLRVQA